MPGQVEEADGLAGALDLACDRLEVGGAVPDTNAGAKSMTGMSRVASSTFFTARDLRMFMGSAFLRPGS